MRKFGWILGGLYLVDGLVTLAGGRRILRWADRRLAPRAHGRVRHLLKRGAHVQPGVIRAWGINNLLAGAGLLLVTLWLQKRTRAAQAA